GLSVHAADETSATEQPREITATLSQCSSTTGNLLDNVLDPDGDEIYITEAVDAAGMDVVANPNGKVSITDPGVDPGIHQVRVEVSDGRDTAEIVGGVEVVPDPAQRPAAGSAHEPACAGASIEIEPIAY